MRFMLLQTNFSGSIPIITLFATKYVSNFNIYEIKDSYNSLQEDIIKNKMNEYIFYTTEGNTIAPNEDYGVENCQVLGCAYGNNKYEAKDNLMKENPWISEAGFCESEFIVRQLMV